MSSDFIRNNTCILCQLRYFVCLSSGVKHISKIIVKQIYPVISAFESECGLVYIFSQLVDKFVSIKLS